MSITQSEWNEMNETDRHEYLQDHQAIVSSQMAIDGNSRVGDDSPAFTVYLVHRGSVLTGRSKSLLEAAEMDHETCGFDVPKIEELDEAYEQHKAVESGDLKFERTK